MIHIKTERLYFRDHKKSDLPGIHSLISDKLNMLFLDDIKTNSITESKLNLDEAVKESLSGSKRTKYFFGIFTHENVYVGEAGFTVLNANTDNTEKLAELGYFIKKEFWNKGYTSEAVEAVIAFAFREAGIIKLVTGCVVENIYSERIMIKHGFEREAYKKKHCFINGKWMDRVEYGLLKENYNL